VHKQFYEAARDGQGTSRLEYLLAQGANLDTRDRIGLTALYYAAFRGDDDNVQYLIERGADLNAEHHVFGTSIAIAALRCHTAVVKTLLQHKADLVRSFPYLGSAFHCACFGGNTDIFKSVLHEFRLTIYRTVRLEAFYALSAADLKPSGFDKLLKNEHFCEGPRIKCPPVFLAAERCHFDILHLCWSEYNHDYFSHNLWDFADDGKVGHKERPQSRIKASYASMESRSGVSNASKASTSSAWSFLGFTSVARENPRCTLLMWAAASLNLPLIDHLLIAGASANAVDEGGQTALHYAALPFADAAFNNVKECVRLLLADQASSGVSSIQIVQKQQPTKSIKSPLDLVVSAEHSALDPRTSYKWGDDIHRTCISSFLDPLPTDNERSKLALEALLHAVKNPMCPIESIKLLCKHAAKSTCGLDPVLTFIGMNKALYQALQWSAAEPVVSTLLDHGALPNAQQFKLPLNTAIASNASNTVVEALLQHGANPDLRQQHGQPLTPREYAKTKKRNDLIYWFALEHPIDKMPDPIPSHPAGPSTTDAQSCDLQEFRSPSSLTVPGVLNDLDEVDELDDLDDLDDLDMDKLKTQSTNNSRDSVGPSRQWFPGMPSFPLARFRRNSKQK
jgi:ankyrin repeat protein